MSAYAPDCVRLRCAVQVGVRGDRCRRVFRVLAAVTGARPGGSHNGARLAPRCACGLPSQPSSGVAGRARGTTAEPVQRVRGLHAFPSGESNEICIPTPGPTGLGSHGGADGRIPGPDRAGHRDAASAGAAAGRAPAPVPGARLEAPRTCGSSVTIDLDARSAYQPLTKYQPGQRPVVHVRRPPCRRGGELAHG